MIYFQLFLVFLQVGVLTIGGGYAAIPIIQSQVVDGHGWLTLSEFTDLISIAEMTPGPFAINCATLVGTQMAGALGAAVATLSFILPSLIIVSLLAFLYYKYRNLNSVKNILDGIRPGIVAVILVAGFRILITSFWGETVSLSNTNILSVCIFAASLFSLQRFKLNPIFVILCAGLLGIIFHLL